MTRRLALVALASASCDFAGAYAAFCDAGHCQDGGQAGGSSSMAGGGSSTAGGSSGGTAGGSAGGGAAGGAAGGSAGGTGGTGGPGVGDGGPNYAFITSVAYSGGLDGSAGADAICQNHADDAGLKGTFRAFLGQSDGGNALAHLGGATGWVRTDGRAFAQNLDDLYLNDHMFYTLTLDEHRRELRDAGIWTGLKSNADLASNSCGRWTLSDSPHSANLVEYDLGTGSYWIGSESGSCDRPRRLYCFGVDRTATLPPVNEMTQTRLAFLSSGLYLPDAGLAGFDSACTAEASAAGLDSGFRALVTTSGASAFMHAVRGLYRRRDGVVFALTALNQMGWDAPLNIGLDGGIINSNLLVWAGAQTVTSLETVACAEWGSTASANSGTTGEPRRLDVFAFGIGGDVGCNTPHRLYCLEQ